MRNHYFLLLLFLLNFTAFAQYNSLSENAEISILTIGPGDNLYDRFGHSAFRIYDPENDIDWAYNYGVYDFNTPNFYTKFARGKLLYKLAVSHYEPFLNSYIKQDRWVKEQVLDLTYSEKKAVFDFLQNNAKPENQYYLYDFFYDNCATKIRDVLSEALDGTLIYDDQLAVRRYTFRELIQQNVHYNTWGSLGMDIGIGAVVDREANWWEYQFLPKYVFEAAASAKITSSTGEKPLVKETRTLYDTAERSNAGNFFLSPLFIFAVIGLILVFVTYRNYKNQDRSRYLDMAIFAVTGLIGIFILLLWFATDHSSTANNYNILWAFPLSFFFAPLIGKKSPKKWLRRYIKFLYILMILLTVHWVSGIQGYALGFLPLLIALFIRYIYLDDFLKKQV